jgi:6,7-dimethyl-8-ribityllumazine synthase
MKLFHLFFQEYKMSVTRSAEGASGESARAIRIALVQSCWHRQIVEQCCDSFVTAVRESGLVGASIDRYEVTGAFEIPLHVKLLASSGAYDIIVAAGFVVDGGIYRHEFVAATVVDALMSIQLDTSVPVISAVLTPQHFHEHGVHERFFQEHMKSKGEEAAEACLATVRDVRATRLRLSAASSGDPSG